jgi:hypothetical protein
VQDNPTDFLFTVVPAKLTCLRLRQSKAGDCFQFVSNQIKRRELRSAVNRVDL